MFKNNKYFFTLLFCFLLLVMISAIAFGAVSILPSDMWSAVRHFFAGQKPANIYEGVFLQLVLVQPLEHQ